VLISPSTVMRLNELSTAAERRLCISTGERAASVVAAQSIVAIAGAIIPAPLAQAPKRTGPSLVSTS
jgi:hypothetical protein